MTNRRLVKRDTRRTIDSVIDYFGDSSPARSDGRTCLERLVDFLFERDGWPAFVPVPVTRGDMPRPAASGRSRRFA
jgi:hypothetical protein